MEAPSENYVETDTGDMADMTDVGDMPDMADVGDAPDMADMGDAPDMADTGDIPDMTNMADMPEATENTYDQKQGRGDDLALGGGEKRWPGWPGESVFRILVPSQKVGGIIGRKGESIKKMCEESRARIKILDGPQGAPEKAVMVSAKEEQDASISPAMDGLLKLHRHIIDGLDKEPGQAPSAGSVAVTRLLVAATQAGSLIGKQGATIKSIKEASNCVVRILDDLPPVALQDDRIVEVQGEPTGVHKAVELISTHLRKFLVDRSVLPLFEMHMQMPHRHMEQHMPPQPWAPPQGLPPNAGSNFGYGGNPGYGGNSGYGGNPGYGGNSGYGGNPGYGNPQFMPPRPHDKFYPPSELPPFEKPPHHGISTYGRDAPPMGGPPSANYQPPTMVSQVTQHLQIPLSYADAVIGNAGASISYIRRASGATVTIQETRGVPGEITVEITGSATQLQTAQQLIQNFMAEAGAPAPAQNTVGSVDQGYSSYQAHGPMYSAPQNNAGLPALPGSGYGASYGTNYGY